MRICHVIDVPLFGPGGAESVAQDQIKACENERYENWVVQFASSDAPQPLGEAGWTGRIFSHDPVGSLGLSWHPKDASKISNHARTILGTCDPRGEPAIERLIRSLAPDLIIFNCVNSPGYLRPLSRLGIPVIVRFAGYIFMCPRGGLVHRTGVVCSGPPILCRVRNTFLWTTTPRPTAVLAQSHYLRNLLLTEGFDHDKVHLLGNPVPVPDAVSRRSEWKRTLVYAGRLEAYKGVMDAISAVEAAPIEGLRLIICGDGPLREQIARRAQLNPDRIQPLGQVPRSELAQVYAQADAMIVPSRTPESFCLSAYEAMALGLPILGTPAGALSEAVIEGKTGFRYPIGDVESLGRCITQLYQSWPRYLAIGQEARLVAGQFSLSRINAAFCHIVRQTLEQR